MMGILSVLQSSKSSSTKQSVETGVIIENYDNNEVPVSVMAKDFLTTYKYGWKTSYYQNTYDIKTDEYQEPTSTSFDQLIKQLEDAQEEDCESCKI